MQIVLDGRKHSKRKRANKRLERFHRLRDRLERKKLEVARFEADMDTLMDLYRTHVLPVEAEEVEPLSRLAEKLTVFMSRRSLGIRDRDELADWFWETEGTIRAFQPELADKLASTFEETVASNAGLTRDELHELIDGHEHYAQGFENSAHQFGAESDNREADIDLEQPDFFGFDSTFDGSEQEEADTGEAFASGPTERVGSDTERLINGDWIRGIFRKTAHALHPDREPDPARRQEKHTLMTRLLEARKQEDVMTILELYCEHVTGGELQVANAELDATCQLIRDRIDALDSEKARMLFANPMGHMVYELLHGKSKRVRERKLDCLVRDIRTRTRELDRLVAELRNLDRLREVLRERRHAAIDLLSELELYYEFGEEKGPFGPHPPF
jgi:hypothetical protein